MRVLVVSNMKATSEAPQRGSFVRDQVRALRGLGLEVEAYHWPPGARNYAPAVREVRRRLRERSFDVVHAHFGLAGVCARLAGADPLVVTFHGTDVRHPRSGMLSRRLARRRILVAAASRALFGAEGGRPGLPRPEGRSAVLPCGADLDRFVPRGREEARRALSLDPAGRYLLFPAAPARPEKRHDRAVAVAEASEATLLTLGSAPPDEVPLWVNASDAVLVTSDYEGFGMAGVEALACGVPVLSTPVGIAPHLMGGLRECLVAGFDAERWAEHARSVLAARPRVEEGRRRAERFGTVAMAERVAAAYRDVVA